MYDELLWHAAPELRRPVLVAAFTGWFDSGGAATQAVQHLGGHDGELLATIDPDGFFDFTARRPTVSIGPDGRRIVAWPRNELRAVRFPDGPHDLVLLSGEEPNARWSTFVGFLVDVCRRLRCEMVVTVGTVADAHPHTRAPLVFGSSTNEALASRLGLSRPRYQGTTGVIGVLHEALETTGVPAISLRAPVPHYLAATPNPRAAMALLVHLERTLGIPTGHESMAAEAGEWDRRHAEAVADNDEAQDYVRRLEAMHDRRLASSLPTEADLAAELDQFLRDLRDDPEPEPDHEPDHDPSPEPDA